MLYLKEKSMQKLYLKACEYVLNYGSPVSDTLEVTNAVLELENPSDNIATSRGDDWGIDLGYALGELAWYFSGHNDTKFISQFGSMWKRLTDDGITNNSGYGKLIYSKFGFDQTEKVVSILKDDPDSRRAKININTPRKNVDTTKDEPCTMFLQFFIRENKLQMTTVMRSNDLWYGTPYDILFFTSLQQVIAYRLGLQCGIYTHFASSLHIYNRNIFKLSKNLYKNKHKRKKYNINAIRMEREANYLYLIASNKNENAKETIINASRKADII